MKLGTRLTIFGKTAYNLDQCTKLNHLQAQTLTPADDQQVLLLTSPRLGLATEVTKVVGMGSV